jgi:putative hemolysin
MQNEIIFEAVLISILILINGALALSEMAIVSAKKIRLQNLAESGDSGAKTALDLANEPSNFLASIQIGITLIGILAGAFGGATISDEISKVVANVTWLAPYAKGIGLGIVVTAVTFLSLVIGELVPKRIALGNAERVASFMSKPIRLLSIVAQPAVRVLTLSTEATIKILGIKHANDQAITEEEVMGMIDQGAESGAFEKAEGSMMKRVLAFGDRRVGELMTQRLQMVALDIDAPFKQNIEKIMEAPHSYFPVYQGTTDHLIGIVSNKCILKSIIKKQTLEIELRDCLFEPLFVSERMATLNLLEKFKETRKHLALVVDEYGSTGGIITLTDLMEAIVGDLPAEQAEDGSGVTRREDGSLLIDGLFPIYELTELLNTEDPHDDVEGDFQTLGGFVMHRLGKIPREGDQFVWEGYRFEVMDMDRHRVDKILVTTVT